MNAIPTPGRVVVGVDGSTAAAEAAAWAAALAARRGAVLHLVHALDVYGLRSLLTVDGFEEYRVRRGKQGHERLDALRDRLAAVRPSPLITTEVCETDPVEALAGLSTSADLLVLGTRGGDGFPALRLGSVALRMAAHSACPLVLVPRGWREPRDGRVVVGVDYREPPQVVDFAFRAADESGAGLCAVHAWNTVPAFEGDYYVDPDVVSADAETMLAETLRLPETVFGERVNVARANINGRPAPVLLRCAADARLLVLGAHRRRSRLSFSLGPVLHAVLSHTPCPVAVVPAAMAMDRAPHLVETGG